MAHVEANSLSDITHLAGNPPKYPRNPTEIKRQPLTLYIARVPGTRDIILTTLKPQLKNVTASDVANSLYFFHLNSEEDARIIEEEQHLRGNTEASPIAQKPVARKALPESARSSLDIKRQSAAPLVRLDSNSSVTKRKPVPKADGVPKLSDPGPRKPPLSRRPLGPRPQNGETTVDRSSFTTTQSVTDNPRNDDEFLHNHDGGNHNMFLRPSLPEAQSHEIQKPPTFTITVIRRDPSSSSQWNVGTIVGHAVPTDGQRLNTSPQRSKKPHFDLSVHLTNPGYTPFNHSYLSSQMDSLKLSPTSPIKSAYNSTSQTKHVRSDPGFDRDVKMEGEDFWRRTKPQHKRSKSDMAVNQGVTRGRSFSGSEVLEVPEAQRPTDPSSTSKGYVFLSPWNGRCKFFTNSSGRSLRCKHSLPEPVSATRGDDEGTPASSSVVVSEIRFNLPSAAIFNSVSESFSKIGESTNQRFSIPAFDHLRSKFSAQRTPPPPPHPPRPFRYSYSSQPRDEEAAPTLPPRPQPNFPNYTESSEDEHVHHHTVVHDENYKNYKNHKNGDENDSPFDLSLGQEKAGGGNRGKRAKLGKLIIHDEGFKFLDLLVAANIGVWWSVWEPDF